MSNIIIDITNDAFELSGDLSQILNRKRIRSNFSSIGADYNSNDKIIIRFNPKDNSSKTRAYNDIERLLGKFDIEFINTSNTQTVLHNYIQDESNFLDFSRKARDIRNNIHEGDNFNNFVSTINLSLKRNLSRQQLLSSYHLSFAQNACNFSVPGAGKTSIVYAAYAYLKNLPIEDAQHVGRMLIICPLSAFGPWENEYQECFEKEVTVKRMVNVDKNERANYFLSLQQSAEITLISYQSASFDSREIQSYLSNHGDVMVVLDEAHRIKNTDIDAKWAKSILSIAQFAKSRVVLTGTPAPNSCADLCNLYKFIWPNKDIIKFPQHYLYTLHKNDDKQKLIEQISPFFIRIKKSHLGLPEANDCDPIYVQMAPDQERIYNHIAKSHISSFMHDQNQKSSGASFSQKLQGARIIRLRQCLTNPSLLKKTMNEFIASVQLPTAEDKQILEDIKNYTATPEKFIKTGELIKDIIKNSGPAGKVIVWANFIENINQLAEYLESIGIDCRKLYGATPNEGDENLSTMQTRESIIREFHGSNCSFSVILANPFAVGESISLHKACHNAIYLEKDFNATNYMQSKDRIHRFGLTQDAKINYYHILSANTIDDSIHTRVKEKERNMLEMIEREEIPLIDLNMTDSKTIDDGDIQQIIKDYYAA